MPQIFDPSSTLVLTLLIVASNCKWKMGHFFLAFSDYLNFSHSSGHFKSMKAISFPPSLLFPSFLASHFLYVLISFFKGES